MKKKKNRIGMFSLASTLGLAALTGIGTWTMAGVTTKIPFLIITSHMIAAGMGIILFNLTKKAKETFK